MRFLLPTWVIIIFILTCTKDVYRLFEGKIGFVIAQDPHWSDLFILPAWREVSKIEFVGHFLMFFILTGMLVAVLGNKLVPVLIAFLYGVVTELLQPFFSRGAELIDVLANTSGILSCVILYGIVKMIDKIRRHVKKLDLEEGHAPRSF